MYIFHGVVIETTTVDDRSIMVRKFDSSTLENFSFALLLSVDCGRLICVFLVFPLDLSLKTDLLKKLLSGEDVAVSDSTIARLNTPAVHHIWVRANNTQEEWASCSTPPQSSWTEAAERGRRKTCYHEWSQIAFSLCQITYLAIKLCPRSRHSPIGWRSSTTTRWCITAASPPPLPHSS